MKETNMKNNVEVFYYSATFCGPCKMFKPIFEQFISNHPEITSKVVIVDEEPPENNLHQVKAVPTVVFVKDGIEQIRFSGTKSKEYLEQLLEDITF